MSIKPPEHLSVPNLDEKSFDVWLSAYQDYKRFARHFTEEEAKKDPSLEVSLFLCVAGIEVRGLVEGLTHDDTLAGIVAAIRKYLRPVTNVVVERNTFFSLKQEPTEEVQEFIVRLKRQVVKCDFADDSVDTIDNQMIRDQLIKGIAQSKIRENLLQEESLTLRRAEGIAASLCAAQSNTKVFENKQEHVLTSYPDRGKSSIPIFNRSHSHSRNYRSHSHSRARNDVTCFTCKKKGHVAKDCYRNHTCAICRKIGHTEKFCRAGKGKSVGNVSLSLTSDAPHSELCFMDFLLNDKPVKLLIDTGSTISLINRKFVLKHDLNNSLQPCNFSGKVADGSKIFFREFLPANLEFKGTQMTEPFYMVDNLDFDGLVGIRCIKRLGLRLGSQEEFVYMLQNPVAMKFTEIFDKPLSKACLAELDPLPVIQLKEGAEPKQCKVRNISKTDKKFADSKIAELLKEGVIKKSNSPWRHQPLVVPKDNGSGKRLVINYKPLNDVTEFDAFPLPDVNTLFEEVGNARYFTKIDFLQFYHQLPLLPEDKPKTAFFYDGELYEYNRCPFGLKNAVAYCFRIMRKVLEGCTGVVIYLDDVCVFGSTREEHDKNLASVLTAIKKHGLALNSSKCDFFKEEISYLGFKLRNQFRSPDPERYSSLRDFPLPMDVRELQRFIGMIGFFSNFIANYADRVAPLYSKLKSFGPWTAEERYCFDSLKNAVFDSCLHVPSKEEKLFLYTDASDVAISGVLVNENGKPIQFCSRKLTQAETRYDIVEREALAVYWSINRCRVFLIGRPFTVFSDHKGLQYIFSNPNATPKVIRWRLNLSDFNFEVRYYRGSENLAADCFSRINFLESSIALDMAEIERSQKACSETKALLKAHQRNFVTKPKAVTASLWSCRRNVTYEDNLVKVNDKVFVPQSLRLKCLILAHGCHLGQDGTYDRIKENLFWPGMKESVKTHVSKCRICSLSKPQFYNPPMSPIFSQAPLHCLAADYIGPLPGSRGFKYCLVVIDIYSRYPFVFPVKSLETSVLCEQFKKIFAICGYPDTILSDRGSNFESQEFLNFCKERSIRKLSTTSYNPKGNSICERFNKTLKSKLFQVLLEKSMDKNCWSLWIDLVLHDYRFAVHATTGFRPVDLFFSFSCRGALPFICSRERRNAAPRMQNSRLKAKKFYDRKASTKFRFFQKGEEVLLRNPVSHTFSSKASVVRVVEDVSPECLRVSFPNGRIDLVNKSRISRLDALQRMGNAERSGNDFDSGVGFASSEFQKASQLPHHISLDRERAVADGRRSPQNRDDQRSHEDRDDQRSARGESENSTSAGDSPRRSRRVRFRTLVYDAADPRDPQLLK